MADLISWPVFVPWFQHQDSGSAFSLNEYVEWPVVFVEADAWPAELTTHQWVQVSSLAPTAAVAQAGAMRAAWREPIPPDGRIKVRGVLMVDYLKPPFVYSRGRVDRIALIRQRQRVRDDGALESTWERWDARELDASVTTFSVMPSGARGLSETGLFVTLAI